MYRPTFCWWCVCSHVLRRQFDSSASKRVHHATTPTSRLSHWATRAYILGRRVSRLPLCWGDVQWSCSGQRRPRGRPRHADLTSRSLYRRWSAVALRQRGTGSVRHPANSRRCIWVAGNVAGRLHRAEHWQRTWPGSAICRDSSSAVEGPDDVVPRLSAFSDIQRCRSSGHWTSNSTW